MDYDCLGDDADFEDLIHGESKSPLWKVGVSLFFSSKPNVIFISVAGRDPDHPDHLSPKYFAQNHYFDHIFTYD